MQRKAPDPPLKFGPCWVMSGRFNVVCLPSLLYRSVCLFLTVPEHNHASQERCAAQGPPLTVLLDSVCTAGLVRHPQLTTHNTIQVIVKCIGFLASAAHTSEWDKYGACRVIGVTPLCLLGYHDMITPMTAVLVTQLP